MIEKEIYRLQTPYRNDMVVKGFQFGKGEEAACILGPVRGNEIQQLYICSQLVRKLKELEQKGCISNNKQVLVVPAVNSYSVNSGNRFFSSENADINRSFPGKEEGTAANRLAAGLMEEIKNYAYGIQFSSFYMTGEFVPHVRMMETGYQNTSLANLFGLPYVVVRKPLPIDTKTLNYNWQNEMTAAFNIYTNCTERIDEKSANRAVSGVLRFLTRMGIIKYESHSGLISHVIQDNDLTDIHVESSGLYMPLVGAGDEIHYGQEIARIIDPCEGHVKDTIIAPTDGIVFYAHIDPLVGQYDIAFRVIRRLHQ
ncbi:MAG: M14 family metallopeptidase [Lachnospiraceae bacterium]